MEKVKILITGPVKGSIQDLSLKLQSLQKSKAGPFDMCFCAGPFFSSDESHKEITQKILNGGDDGAGVKIDIDLPLPVYFCDVGTLPAGCELNLYNHENDAKKDDDEIDLSPEKDEDEEEGDDDANKSNTESGLPKGIMTIASNLYLLHGISSDQTQTADILNIPISTTSSTSSSYITVAFVPPNARINSAQTIKFESKTSHPSFVGVDLLLTSDWGQGMASSSCISQQDRVKLGLEEDGGGSSNGLNIREMGTYDVAELASQCRPRYHIAPALVQSKKDADAAMNAAATATDADTGTDPSPSTTGRAETSFFFQSIPYANPPSALSSGMIQNYHMTRFLALCPVVDAATQKRNGKAKKYIHALGIQPLWNMDRETATYIPENVVVVPSPYTDDSYQKDSHHQHSHGMVNNRNVNVGLSEAQTRRIISEDMHHGQTPDHRWNIRNRKRPLHDDSSSGAVDPANCSLFLHGLHNDVTGGMTLNRESIRDAFQSRGCWRVRMPSSTSGHANPSYCFLDFHSHEEAKLCLESSGGEELVLGVPLTMKWSRYRAMGGVGVGSAPPPPPPLGHVGIYNVGNGPPAKRSKSRLTEEEAADSSSLFVHLNVPVHDASHELCSKGIVHVGTLAQKVLEDAINADGDSDGDRVTAEDEPALKVTARPLVGKHCGFLDFASHAAASMALATMTGSTDGGEMQDNIMTGSDKEGELKDALKQVQLWWARSKDTSSVPKGNENGSQGQCFQFRSQHFPPDARTDCWFCLASPTCEKHLIVSVLDNCYITMPKGPVNKHHALIVPVNHSASEGMKKTPILGAFLDPTPGAVADVEEAKAKLRKFANEELDKDLFVFERAIPTRGGYHAHINCVPVDRGLGSKIRTTMLSMAAGAGFSGDRELRELQNPDISITSILKNADEDELVGYFYAEIPFGENGDVKRFLYTALNQDDRVNRKKIPLQFGREVLASALGDDNLAHWKGCVLSKEIEEEYTETFRKSFAKFE